MQWDYVYADLQLQVTFDADGTSPFGQLNDGETLALDRIIYMALMEFQYIRALHTLDIAGLQAIIENYKKHQAELESGG